MVDISGEILLGCSIDHLRPLVDNAFTELTYAQQYRHCGWWLFTNTFTFCGARVYSDVFAVSEPIYSATCA